jgi:hypothetical protein
MGGKRRVREPASRPPRLGPFDRWQTLLAAVVAALASIVVAVITTRDGGDGGSLLAPRTPETPETPVLTISAVSEQPEPPPPTARRYVFMGTAHLDSGERVVVLVRAATPSAAATPPAVAAEASGEPWLVSPPAKVTSEGIWTVSWVLATPPPAASWTAVIVYLPLSEPSTGTHGVEPTEGSPPPSSQTTTQPPEASSQASTRAPGGESPSDEPEPLEELALAGPCASGVVAIAVTTASSSPPECT